MFPGNIQVTLQEKMENKRHKMIPGNIVVTMQEKMEMENKRHEPTPRHWQEE